MVSFHIKNKDKIANTYCKFSDYIILYKRLSISTVLKNTYYIRSDLIRLKND